MKVLITGSDSGLGKFLCEELGKKNDVFKFNRSSNYQDIKDKYFDLIIHCAARIQHCNWDNVDYSFLNDNIFLTKKISSINHKKFIYISSIDQNQDTPYGISKRISEKIISSQKSEFCIIRPSGLIGKGMKENTFLKIVKDLPIALTSDSILDFTLYEDVLKVIEDNINGVINLTSNESITVGNIVKILKRENVSFGNIKFKINFVESDFDTKRSSKEKILYIEEELL